MYIRIQYLVEYNIMQYNPHLAGRLPQLRQDLLRIPPPGSEALY